MDGAVRTDHWGAPVTRGTPERSPEQVVKARRGTTNRNDRGSASDRAARRAYLLRVYRADVDVMGIVDLYEGRSIAFPVLLGTHGAVPACRCYRCGALLTDETLTIDRIKPGRDGGTYRRDNIRPACGQCNSETGGGLARRKK